MRTSPLPTPVGATRRRLEVSLELTLDSALSSTARLILGGLSPEDGRPVVWPTDRELADRHGVSERTVRGALLAGESAGWISRTSRAKLSPELARRVPRDRPTRRLIVLHWLSPATSFRQQVAGQTAVTGRELPVRPAETCRSLARAPVSNSSDELTREIRTTFVASAPEGEISSHLPAATRELFARSMARAEAEESTPGFVRPTFKVPRYNGGLVGAPPAAKRVKVEEMVTACLGPDSAVAVDALVLWLKIGRAHV